MDNLSSTKEGQAKLKKAYPKYERYENSIPWESRELLHAILPSPLIEWDDFGERKSPSFAERTARDFSHVKRMKAKRKELENKKNGKE